MKHDLVNVLDNRSWSQWSAKKLIDMGFFPNRIRHNETENRGAIVIQRSNKGKDWALNEKALLYCIEAERAGRVGKAYVVLLNEDNTVRKHLPVLSVKTRLNGTPTANGEYGPYWWINEEFVEATERASF